MSKTLRKIMTVSLCGILLTGCGKKTVKEEVKSTPDVMETKTTPEPTPVPTTVPAPTPEPTPTPVVENDPDTIRPEIKEAMDACEKYIDEYVAFMENYDSSDLSEMTTYLEMLDSYAEAMDKLDAMDENSMTPAEQKYYEDTMMRIAGKLAAVPNA